MLRSLEGNRGGAIVAGKKGGSPQIRISLGLATTDDIARSALECGSSSYRLPPVIYTETVQVPDAARRQLLLPHSKVPSALIFSQQRLRRTG